MALRFNAYVSEGASPTTFGVVPIYGNDVALHGIIAVAAAYVGFVMPARPVRMR